MSEPLAYRIKDAARLLGMGKSKLFELIADGRLPARKIGGATVILRTDLISFLEHAPRAHGRD
jgi:excisionase family DNA binding protein